jgi:hypothetical protein
MKAPSVLLIACSLAKDSSFTEVMREPITKLAIVPISSIDGSIVKQLAVSLRPFSINGGGNESPVIFFVGRVIAKGERNTTERRIVLVTLKHVIVYDEQGRQVHAVHIVDIARVVVCQDGFAVLKVPREHDMVIKLDQSLYLDYFLNILKVLHLHFAIGSPIASDVPLDRRRPQDASGAPPGLLIQGSSTPCDQLTGGNAINLTRNPNAQYLDNVAIPSILNVDTSKQDFLSLLLHVPPPPKRSATDAQPVSHSAQDLATANAVMQHPLFRPVLEARAQQQQQGSSLTAPPSVTSSAALLNTTAPPSPMTRAVHTQPPPVPSHSAANATPARVSSVTVRSIATIDRSDDSPIVSPRIEDRLLGGPTGWLRAAEPTPPSGVEASPPPPPPPLTSSHGTSSPLQKLMQPGTPPQLAPPHISAPSPSTSTSKLHDRVEGFMKLYMPQHLHLTEKIASDYRGRDEECIKMLFARLEHEQRLAATDDQQSSLFLDRRGLEADDAFQERYHAPSAGHHHAQQRPVGAQKASEGGAAAAVLLRLERLEEENRQLRDAQAVAKRQHDSPSASYHQRAPRHYDAADHSPFDSSEPVYSLHPHKQRRHEREPRSSDDEDDHHGDQQQWHRHTSGRPAVSARPVQRTQSLGSMEEFEASIEGRIPRERVVLRQHRLDELRKEVHRLISSDDSRTNRRSAVGSTAMQSVIRIGLLQDEIVAMAAKQQLDVSLAEEDADDRVSGFSAHQNSRAQSRPSMPLSGFSSRTPSEFAFPSSQRALDALPKPTSSAAPQTAAAPQRNAVSSAASEDPAYAQWYYSEYIPRMMYQQQKAQHKGH